MIVSWLACEKCVAPCTCPACIHISLESKSGHIPSQTIVYLLAFGVSSCRYCAISRQCTTKVEQQNKKAGCAHAGRVAVLHGLHTSELKSVVHTFIAVQGLSNWGDWLRVRKRGKWDSTGGVVCSHVCRGLGHILHCT